MRNATTNLNSTAATRRSARGADGRLKPLLLIAAFLVLALPVFLLMRGCETDVAIRYGSRQALLEGNQSINGLGVLSEMFVKAGHSVASTSRLSPKIDRSADVIVWFINDFNPPSKQAITWLEDWLEDEPERTLIVVPRDFDAEPLYWTKVTPQANAQQAAIVTSKGGLAALRVATERAPTATQPEDWGWFRFDRSAALKQRGVTTLTGDAGWTAGVDPTKVEIELHGRITPKDDEDEILLETTGDVLVFRHRIEATDWRTPPRTPAEDDDDWDWTPLFPPSTPPGSKTPSKQGSPSSVPPGRPPGKPTFGAPPVTRPPMTRPPITRPPFGATPPSKPSPSPISKAPAVKAAPQPAPWVTGDGSGQVIVVANGSFLLNMMLVNHEHRKLAGALINEVGPRRSVFFLEAGGGVEVLTEDPPPPKLPSSMMYFDVPRIQNLLWHLAVFTLIVCFGLFAIHGRPRRAARPNPNDFGRHVEALGDLLSQTGDSAYAQAKLAQYRSSCRAETARRGKK